MQETWYVEHGYIEEYPVPGMRLGRHVRHDSRNLAYPWRKSRGPLTSQLWPRHIGILDQGNVGSCTGEEQVGALGTGPLWDALTAAERITLTQDLAYRIYSAAETIDGDGPWPPNDNGSSGPSAAQAAKNLGLVSGYLHCFSLADVLDALETGPVGIGSNWYDSMDSPDNNGLVVISPGASIRGGHEYLCRGKDTAAQLVRLDNSWGTGFGVNGSFTMSYATLERLLAEQGDGTVSLPLTVPLPQPVPVPPVPVPVPVPVPPDPDPGEGIWAAAVLDWSGKPHAGANARAAKATRVRLRDLGYLR